MNLRHYLAQAWAWIQQRVHFRRVVLPPPLLLLSPPRTWSGRQPGPSLPTIILPAPHVKEAGWWKYRRQDVEQGGTFFFRRAILDEIDVYFKVIDRLYRGDRQAYQLFGRVGASLLPADALVEMGRFGEDPELPAVWHDRTTRPAFGALALALDVEDTESVYPRLMYFHKLDLPPSYVEPSSGDVYEVCKYYDFRKPDEKAPKWLRRGGFVVQFHVAVEHENKVRLLKHLKIKYQHVTYRGTTQRGNKSRKTLFDQRIPHKLWDYPAIFKSGWEEKKSEYPRVRDIQQYAAETFKMIVEWALAAETGLRVTVSDGGRSAAFAIDMKRTAYFFKDREMVLTAKGARARIFHVVRPHIRVTARGKKVACRMHFRGLRSFNWRGYQVHITMPGLHHRPVMELNSGFLDLETAAALGHDVNGHGVEQLADKIRGAIHGSV